MTLAEYIDSLNNHCPYCCRDMSLGQCVCPNENEESSTSKESSKTTAE